MTRYHATAQGQVPFTPEEEAEWDAQEAAYIAETPKREAREQITALEATVTPRRIREAATSTAGKTWLANVDSQIAALRAQL